MRYFLLHAHYVKDALNSDIVLNLGLQFCLIFLWHIKLGIPIHMWNERLCPWLICPRIVKWPENFYGKGLCAYITVMTPKMLWTLHVRRLPWIAQKQWPMSNGHEQQQINVDIYSHKYIPNLCTSIIMSLHFPLAAHDNQSCHAWEHCSLRIAARSIASA